MCVSDFFVHKGTSVHEGIQNFCTFVALHSEVR